MNSEHMQLSEPSPVLSLPCSQHVCRRRRRKDWLSWWLEGRPAQGAHSLPAPRPGEPSAASGYSHPKQRPRKAAWHGEHRRALRRRRGPRRCWVIYREGDLIFGKGMKAVATVVERQKPLFLSPDRTTKVATRPTPWPNALSVATKRIAEAPRALRGSTHLGNPGAGENGSQKHARGISRRRYWQDQGSLPVSFSCHHPRSPARGKRSPAPKNQSKTPMDCLLISTSRTPAHHTDTRLKPDSTNPVQPSTVNRRRPPDTRKM